MPLAVVLLGVVGAFGAIGLAGIPLTLVTISGLPILIGLGVDRSRALGLPLRLVQVVPPGQAVETTARYEAVEAGHLPAAAHRVGDVERCEVVRHEDPETGLVDLASTGSVAMLVMTTHGRTGWNRLRVGSVTAATVHRAPVPVLVVPASLSGSASGGSEGEALPGPTARKVEPFAPTATERTVAP